MNIHVDGVDFLHLERPPAERTYLRYATWDTETASWSDPVNPEVRTACAGIQEADDPLEHIKDCVESIYIHVHVDDGCPGTVEHRTP